MQNNLKRRALQELAKREKVRRIEAGEWSLSIGDLSQNAATIASGVLAEPLAGLVGIAGLPFGVDVASNAIERTKEALTYKPRTIGAMQNLEKLAYNLEPIGSAISNLSKVPGDFVYDKTGSPLLATAAYSAIPAFTEALGLKGASRLPGKRYEFGDISDMTKTPLAKQRGAVAGINDAGIDEMITKVIDDSLLDGLSTFGIRVMTPNPKTGKSLKVKVGDSVDNSYQWIDGQTTSDQLEGVSTLKIKYDGFEVEDIKKSLDELDAYGEGQRVLIGGRSSYDGNDINESVISDGVILHIFE